MIAVAGSQPDPGYYTATVVVSASERRLRYRYALEHVPY